MTNRSEHVASEILSILLDSNAARIQTLTDDLELAPLVRTYISDRFGVDSVSDLSVQQVRDLIEFIETFRKVANQGMPDK